MERLKLIALTLAMACSSSVAQDSPHTVVPHVVAPRAVVPPSTTEAVVEPAVPVRKAVRTSLIENEWFTKICVSEGNFNILEAQKLLQTLENMRDRRADKSLLNAMYAQSSKITRREEFTDTRQIWVSYLPMQGTDPPSKGWIECTGKDRVTQKPTPLGCTGTWRATVDLWVQFRKQAKELYFSGIVPSTIPGKPIQWGGDMDYWRGEARNFCPLNVGGIMQNTYWGDPRDFANAGECLPIDKTMARRSKMISAEIASGRAQRRHRIPQLLGENSLIPRQEQELPPSHESEQDDTTSID